MDTWMIWLVLVLCVLLIIPRLLWGRITKYIARHARADSDGLLTALLPSAMGIALCVICLTSGTYAWFIGSLSAPVASIETGFYDIQVKEVSVISYEILETAAATDTEPASYQVERQETGLTPGADGSYVLEPGSEYIFTLEASGSASAGFGSLKFPGHTCYTETIPTKPGQNIFRFQLVPTEQITVNFACSWGDLAEMQENAEAAVKESNRYAISVAGLDQQNIPDLAQEKQDELDKMLEEQAAAALEGEMQEGSDEAAGPDAEEYSAGQSVELDPYEQEGPDSLPGDDPAEEQQLGKVLPKE